MEGLSWGMIKLLAKRLASYNYDDNNDDDNLTTSSRSPCQADFAQKVAFSFSLISFLSQLNWSFWSLSALSDPLGIRLIKTFYFSVIRSKKNKRDVFWIRTKRKTKRLDVANNK